MADPLDAIAARTRLPPITVDVTRGAIVESRHVVYGALWGAREEQGPVGGVRIAWGDAALVTFLRSALKPFQALPLLVDGVADRLAMDDEALALACGSHSGEARHLDALARLLRGAGIGAEALRCAAHAPYHEPTAHSLGAAFDARHNNCSGKHAGLLAWTKDHGADLDTYLDAHHPVQRRVLALVSVLSGVPQKEIGSAVDGCGVPTLALTLGHAARLFHLLGAPDAFRRSQQVDSVPDGEVEPVVAGLARLAGAMAAHPHLVAGTGRADTEVIARTQGRWVTKSGAEGLWCGVHRPTGTAFAFKAIDGGFRAVVPAALEALSAQGLLDDAAASALHALRRPVVHNRAGLAVGEIVPRLP